MLKLTKLPRLSYYVLPVLVLIFTFYSFNLFKQSEKELSLINHPPKVNIVGYTTDKTNLELNSIQEKETLLQLYNEEFKRNGWLYICEYETPELERVNKTIRVTGYTLHYAVYAKDDLMLRLKLIRDSTGKYINAFYIKIELKQNH
ncbi:MAG: hypothetical protein H6Q74_3109 [Firmicutes bacterium]|nr:hypothetical protein [Bacillota bacterium]